MRLLAARAYAEWDLPQPDHRQRHESWSAALPGVDAPLLAELAARYRMGGDELRAVAAVAGAGARFAGNGRPAPLADHVRPAVEAVTRGRSGGFVRAVTPRRTLDDLVLPPEQLRHITEIAAAFRAWPRVAETWGFGRHPGDAGVLVILASNLRENIDAAFTRRFHFVVNFTRPAPARPSGAGSGGSRSRWPRRSRPMWTWPPWPGST